MTKGVSAEVRKVWECVLQQSDICTKLVFSVPNQGLEGLNLFTVNTSHPRGIEQKCCRSGHILEDLTRSVHMEYNSGEESYNYVFWLGYMVPVA